MSSLAPGTESERSLNLSPGQRLGGVTVGRARHAMYRGVLEVASYLPLGAAYAVARALGRVRFRILHDTLRVNRDVVRALGATQREVDELARRASELRASEELEAFVLRRADSRTLARVVRIEGLEHVEAALADGKGAILYSCHIRSTAALFAALARAGHPPAIVGFPAGREFLPEDRRFLRRQSDVLERRFHCRYLYMQPGNLGVAVKTANVLRENGLVVMLVDKPPRRTAVEVDWLGGRRAFSSGPALVARETGAPLLDFYVHRGGAWCPQVAVVGQPHRVDGDLDPAVQECARRLEAHVRSHPAQWSFLSSYASDVTDATDLGAPG